MRSHCTRAAGHLQSKSEQSQCGRRSFRERRKATNKGRHAQSDVPASRAGGPCQTGGWPAGWGRRNRSSAADAARHSSSGSSQTSTCALKHGKVSKHDQSTQSKRSHHAADVQQMKDFKFHKSVMCDSAHRDILPSGPMKVLEVLAMQTALRETTTRKRTPSATKYS